MRSIIAGLTDQFAFILTNASGVAVDADDTPSVTVYNMAGGLIDSEDASRIVGASFDGHYTVQLVFDPADYDFGTTYQIVARATVDGVEVKQIIETFRLDVSRRAGSISDGAPNTETVFGTYLTETTDNHWKDALITMVSGALVGQVKKVSAYDGTTKKITVSGGFTDPPTEDDRFELSVQ